MNFENIFQNLFHSIKTTDKNFHNNHNCLSSTPTYPIYPKPFQALGKTSACEIHPTTESKVSAPLHMRQRVQRLTDSPQVRSGARTSRKSTAPSNPVLPHPEHQLGSSPMESTASSSADRKANPVLAAKSQYWHLLALFLRPLSVYTCAWKPAVPGTPPHAPGLLHSQPQCPQGAWGCHNSRDADPVTSHPPEAPTPWGTCKSKNENNNNKCDLGDRLLCPDFLRVWSGSQKVLD